MKTNTYYYRIKIFFIFLAAVSQAFLVLTTSASYLNAKISTYNILKSQQNSFYRDEMNMLCVKTDNLLYVLENSGALKFCSDNSVFAPLEETQKRYNNIKSNLSNSSLSSRYFSGYYLLGKNKNQISFKKSGNEFSDPGTLNLHYERFINDYAVNNFTKNYQKLFLFDKNDFKDIKVDKSIQRDYNEMLDTLEGKIVYFTLEKDVFCIFIVNPQFFETVFSNTDVSNSSVAIFNSSGNLFYEKGDLGKDITAADINNAKFHTYTTDQYMLVTSSHLKFTLYDLLFFGSMLIICILIILWAIYVSKLYADKIIEPYRIFKGFFDLNYKTEDLEEIDYLNMSSGKKRSDISKNILRALMGAIIIPTILSSAVYLTALNFFSDRFIENRMSDSHIHLTQKLYDTFDFYLISAGIYDNSGASGQLSRMRYTVMLDENFSLNIQKYDKLNYISSSLFNRQIKQLKNMPNADGTLIYIDSDLFGDNALASIHKSEKNTYTLNVFKYETMGSIVPDSNTEFMLLDADNHIISQNLSVDDEEKQKIIDGDRKKVIHKTKFEDFNWTLYSFSDISVIKKDIYSIIYMDITAILTFLLFIMIFSWIYSSKFMTPLERIKTAMSEANTTDNNIITNDSNEIEEVLNVYNKMVRHIKKMTKDKIDLVCKEEQANALKSRAELNALQQQINPHFLHNTLEMINLSVLKTGDISTSKLVGKLSKIFRYAISSVTETVFLYEEIENTKNYMSVWNTRFPNRYEFIWDVDDSLLNTKVLKLIMQPIMENCFFHAFNDSMTNCVIKTQICYENDYLYITVSDNGSGMSRDKIKQLYDKFSDDSPDFNSKGIGIWNVYKRLKLYYGDSASITVTANENTGTAIQIKFIPE